MSKSQKITIARGDGVGPEIMDATLSILEAAGARIEIEAIEIGEKVYASGVKNGIAEEAWESLRRNRVFLKAPITTPQGGGFNSLNVTVRKAFGLFANVRPAVAYAPFVHTKHPGMDVVICRENEEDLYAGIEYQQTPEVTQCLKLISRKGCERICRYAFEYARKQGRQKVTCLTKDNIMKFTDGLFHKVFLEVAKAYPDIVHEHWIIDIGAAKLADTPENFDVLVMPNLYGDILSDLTAQISGSVGLGGSANIGEDFSMFEAIHGSAPRRAGKDMANPSGLLLGAVMMLNHIGQGDVAEKIHNALLRTIEEGLHTYDLYTPEHSQQKLGTRDFAKAISDRLGQRPEKLKAVVYDSEKKHTSAPKQSLESNAAEGPEAKRRLGGVDVFVYWKGTNPEHLGKQVEPIRYKSLALKLISSAGLKVYPGPCEAKRFTDHWRCRFYSEGPMNQRDIAEILTQFDASGLEFIKTENLYFFDGKPGFSLAQGE